MDWLEESFETEQLDFNSVRHQTGTGGTGKSGRQPQCTLRVSAVGKSCLCLPRWSRFTESVDLCGNVSSTTKPGLLEDELLLALGLGHALRQGL